MSSSFRGNLFDRPGVNLEVGDPGERGGFTGDRFLAFDGVKAPRPPLVVAIGQVVDPTVDAVHTTGGGAFQSVFRTQPQKTLKVLPNGGHVSGLEREHIICMKIFGQLQGPAAGVETVAGKADRQEREVLPELRKQSAQRLQFTILFLSVTGQGRIPVRVLNELAGHRQGQTGWPEQFGFQNLMQIHGVRGVPVDQTMRAMLLPKRQMTGGVEDHNKSPLQAGGVQGLHADEAA